MTFFSVKNTYYTTDTPVYTEHLGEKKMGFTNKIIPLAIGLLVASAILPGAVVAITNTTLWEGAPTSVITLIPVLGIVVIAGLAMMLLRK